MQNYSLRRVAMVRRKISDQGWSSFGNPPGVIPPEISYPIHTILAAIRVPYLIS
jgi:hypothetical protein